MGEVPGTWRRAHLSHGFQGVGTRISPSNAVYDRIGHFGVAGEAICKALFLGGVTRRFPKLKFAFLEGVVGWACGLYSDLIGHWKKRNPKALEDIDPANLNREMLAQLFQRYGGKALADKLERWKIEGEAYSPRTADPTASLDDFEACAIERADQIRDLFIPNFYFGCGADDAANAWAFNTKADRLPRPAQCGLRLRYRPLRRPGHDQGADRGTGSWWTKN